MALINVENVEVLDNPASFLSPFRFLITFECVAPGIKEELEWKLIYIGSAEDEKYDQELDAILVGPVNIGRNKFEFTAPAPDPSRIPEKDLVEVTAILLTCSYKNKEFIRVGYYVNNYVEGEEAASSSSSSASSSLPTPSARPDFVDAAAAVAQREAEAQAQPPAPMQSEPMAADANSASAQPRENGAPNGTDVGADSGSGVAEAAASAPQDMEADVEVVDEEIQQRPSRPVDINKLWRNILSDRPRVTRFQIPWDTEEQQPLAAMASMDADVPLHMNGSAQPQQLSLSAQPSSAS
jgi:hypothetical protein